MLGLVLYGTVYLLPVYLAQIQGYNAMQIGEVVMWMGLPQLVIFPLVPFVDATGRPSPDGRLWDDHVRGQLLHEFVSDA